MSGVKIGVDAGNEIVFITLVKDDGTETTVSVPPDVAHMLGEQLKVSATVLDKYNTAKDRESK